MSTTVQYKGNTLATVSGDTKTLKTSGKYMEADVILTDDSVDGDLLGYGTEETLRTVLYTDGTLIINEKSSDIEANVAKHGEATNTYPACDRSTSNNPYNVSGINMQPWKNQKTSILNVELGSVVKPIYGTRYWFYGFNNCLSIDLKGLDTSSIEYEKSMFGMFNGCNNLTSLDLGDKFDTSAVTNMNSMFNGCKVLTSLDLGDKFDTSSVTNMNGMFYNCYALASLNLGDEFNTSAVTDMNSMFKNCSALTSLDLGDKFDTSSVTSMSAMFNNCINLITIYAKLDFVLYAESLTIFLDDKKLVGGNGTKYTDMTGPSYAVYARIDKAGAPGYFTDRSQKPVS